MAMTEITRNGVTTIENILSSVDEVMFEDEQHEAILWNDGSLTIESMEYQITTSDRPDHTRLDIAAVRQLRNFLNSQRITEMLASA